MAKRKKVSPLCVYTNNQVRCSVRAMPAACTVMTYHGSRAEPNKHRAPAHKTVRGRQTRPHLNSSCATTHIHFEDKPSQHSSENSPLIPAVPQRAHWQSEDYFTAVFPVFTDSELLRSWSRPKTSLWHPFSNFHKFTASASYKRKATLQIKSRLTRPHLFMRPAQWRLLLFPREEAHFRPQHTSCPLNCINF